ncbi:Peroxidase 2 [Dichanthelium oligosanthes]|uniref:Peroxidase 2 n=1 Tax=Dichanthelium oligosanthes TaxID=888268 RepID=A0A1E5USP5_9POAL|nr:Peroxidase 2 [Dichanthelium oligosanthes]
MAFHDWFVQGCEASVLLDPTPANPRPEKLGPPNFPSLRGFEVVDAAKAVLERVCPGKVSCDDIVQFAARDAAFFLSGYKGLDVDDLVVLSGSHTVGRSHCSSSSDRMGTPPFDINPGLAALLRRQCPANPNITDDPTVPLDVVTPNRLDNQYYMNVVLFNSDAALLTSRLMARKMVETPPSAGGGRGSSLGPW